jgi:hypothetical protein
MVQTRDMADMYHLDLSSFGSDELESKVESIRTGAYVDILSDQHDMSRFIK